MPLDPIAQTSCPVPYVLQATRGDSIDIRLRLFDGATGRPIVLTGWSGVANVYDTPLGGAILHTLTVVVDQSPASQPTTGEVLISTGINETSGWIESGYWALVLTDGSSSKTIVAGPWQMAGNSIGLPSFVCGSGGSFGAGGLCGSPGIDVLGTGCEVLASGYTEIVLPHPQSVCACV